mmetsp:Transcript_20035/g.47756  ORF Transcript_20035/g.47756 Transcript_20035/m.47756 type:complete len:577 (+) Transcript_20035:130-1860(+)
MSQAHQNPLIPFWRDGAEAEAAAKPPANSHAQFADRRAGMVAGANGGSFQEPKRPSVLQFHNQHGGSWKQGSTFMASNVNGMDDFLASLRDGTLDSAAMEKSIAESQARHAAKKQQVRGGDKRDRRAANDQPALMKRERSSGTDRLVMEGPEACVSSFKRSHRPDDLHAITPGQEFSLIADVADDQSEGVFMPLSPAHDDESVSSRMHTPIPDGSEMFRKSHQTLRGILRSGMRLTETLFHKVEQLGSESRLPSAAQENHLLAVGGSGMVWKMELRSDPSVVCAMKTVPLHIKVADLEAFEADIQLAYGHQHPNIVPLYDVCCKRMEEEDMWHLCIYMHYADSGSLASLVSKWGGPLPVELVIGAGKQTLDALGFLHDEAKVCHRDLKPSNVLVRSDGRVMLQDFGNSKQLDKKYMQTYVGCPAYMSPERISGLQYTTKSDVWALGMILMECLIGKFPYHALHETESYERLLGRIVDDNVPLHLMQDHGVPALVAQLVSRCLDKDQSARPNSAGLLSTMEETRQALSGGVEHVELLGSNIGVADFGGGVPEEVEGVRIFATRNAPQRAVARYVWYL